MKKDKFVVLEPMTPIRTIHHGDFKVRVEPTEFTNRDGDKFKIGQTVMYGDYPDIFRLTKLQMVKIRNIGWPTFGDRYSYRMQFQLERGNGTPAFKGDWLSETNWLKKVGK